MLKLLAFDVDHDRSILTSAHQLTQRAIEVQPVAASEQALDHGAHELGFWPTLIGEFLCVAVIVYTIGRLGLRQPTFSLCARSMMPPASEGRESGVRLKSRGVA